MEFLKKVLRTNQIIYKISKYFHSTFLSIIDIFIYAPLSYDNNLEVQFDENINEDPNITLRLQKNQKKYEQPFKLIKTNKKIRIIDLACGRGELQQIFIDQYKGEFEYLGLDYDDKRINEGIKLGRNIKKCDLSDFENLDEIIKREGPFDVIFCMYALYFLPRPEAFMKFLNGKAPKIILGVLNGGSWSNRLRYLFGKAPIPSITQYSNNKVNYEEIARLWTLTDWRFIFKSLGYNNFKLIAVKSQATSIHYKPWRFLAPSLSGLGFVFMIEC